MGRWISAYECFSEKVFNESIEMHEKALDRIIQLESTVIFSRPKWCNGKRINEALVARGQKYYRVHVKRKFPNEPGFWEDNWFDNIDNELSIFEMAGWKCGALLCTDAMFLEDARELRAQGAEVIFVPRATSRSCDNLWHDTLSLIARHNGCYVISSNRSRSENSLIDFSGLGFFFARR